MMPLEGYRVIDISRTLAGPYATMMLADMGAEVIKVEEPIVGDESRRFTPPSWNGESCYYLSANRNKKGITVNLKTPEGIQIVKDLLKDADVIIENFRTGTVEKLGLGYDVVKEINPKIVFCSISGFGRTGPYKDKAGYDVLLQGYGGLMSITGTKDTPVKAGMSIADLSAGMFAAFSIVNALLAAQRNGVGQYLDVSLLDCQVALLNHMATGYLATGKYPERMGTAHGTLVPYRSFKAKDQDVVVAVANDGLWKKFCQALDWVDLLEDERFKLNHQRVALRDELEPIIEERFKQLTSEDIISRLDSYGVPCGPIQNIAQVMNDPQVIARNMMVDIEHPNIPNLKVPAFPVKFSNTPPTIRNHPPLLGEHTEEILKSLGYQEEQIEELRSKTII
ncbi:CaiB/BaiF CoA transferase family protein [Lysinibacillus endophyticus]|uniref:CaiB/BaiF CoA transferase family protein n=1 Tax=Ureibacillus endophyticus TaxID=1978490 RepID=UPI0020A0DF06|nr:CaiB/BaiF CoA-transferase family protein [Lysinibacillus endophyticus]MCP1146693.1 CoA transferase [Lysinibacillus endophyticus]